MQITTIGLDIAKNVFQVHGIDTAEKVIVRKPLRRSQVICLCQRRTPDVWMDGTRIAIVWDEPMPGVGRPWFECPACLRKCRYLYLRNNIACARCHRLQNASRHLRRQTPGVGRVERLRRKLGGRDIRPFASLPACRRGRSREYHERLVAQIHAEEAKLLSHLSSVVRDLARRIQVRKAKHQW
jgi:hypothetical protein